MAKHKDKKVPTKQSNIEIEIEIEKKPSKKKSNAKQRKMKEVMTEYKDGDLHSGSKTGPKVKKRDQALAIAYSEAKKTKKKKK